jgi:hypothetical protein
MYLWLAATVPERSPLTQDQRWQNRQKFVPSLGAAATARSKLVSRSKETTMNTPKCILGLMLLTFSSGASAQIAGELGSGAIMGVDLQKSGNQWRIENTNENAVWVRVAQPSYNQHLLIQSHQIVTVGQNEAESDIDRLVRDSKERSVPVAVVIARDESQLRQVDRREIVPPRD